MHRVHHSDNLVDSTSSLRLHPIEVLFQVSWRTIAFALLGIPFASVVILFTIFLPLLFIQHANIRFPVWLEKPLSVIFVTSSWHKVHHSDEQRYTDSHYGNTFTFWDRIFGTYHKKVAIDQLKWGLSDLKNDRDQTVKSQLTLPFKKLKG
jgi:sterol desaturase/sphingolipid hydroxylase (fatty acid hydroxylase superfamily)